MVSSMDTLNAPKFHDDEAARQYLESLRWPDGPVCPHCGVINHAYADQAHWHVPLCREGMP